MRVLYRQQRLAVRLQGALYVTGAASNKPAKCAWVQPKEGAGREYGPWAEASPLS